MQFFQSLLPDSLLRMEKHEVDAEAGHLTFSVASTQATTQCPLCGSFTQRVHSRYERTLADLPCVPFTLTLLMTVSKFFCPNTEYHRRIFTERLPAVAAPWARKTARLVEHLQAIGLALGGAAGARLELQLGYWSCGSTLLNHLQSLPLPPFDIPKVLGVDDFAFRKGHNYGTILVDLETHQPIALLADRKAETLATWLEAHPGIEVLSRDRSKTYRNAMTESAPNAIPVADRIHLVKNLSDALAQAFGSYRRELKAAEQSQQHQDSVTETPETTVLAIAKPTATEQSQQRIQQNQHRKIEQ